MSLPFDPFNIPHEELTAWIFWLILFMALIQVSRLLLEIFSAKEKEY